MSNGNLKNAGKYQWKSTNLLTQWQLPIRTRLFSYPFSVVRNCYPRLLIPSTYHLLSLHGNMTNNRNRIDYQLVAHCHSGFDNTRDILLFENVLYLQAYRALVCIFLGPAYVFIKRFLLFECREVLIPVSCWYAEKEYINTMVWHSKEFTIPFVFVYISHPRLIGEFTKQLLILQAHSSPGRRAFLSYFWLNIWQDTKYFSSWKSSLPIN